MNCLPDSLPVLDAKLQQVELLSRQRSALGLDEAAFERLFVEHLACVEEVLRSTGVIAINASLKLLRQQLVHAATGGRSDVILGEVVGGRLRRVVLAEVKLARNPEFRRELLTQLLDYAASLRRPSPGDVRALFSSATDWVDDERALLELMRRGETLLLVVGDEVRHDFVERARAILDLDLISQVRIAFLSLALFRGERTTLLVPNVVGVLSDAKRELRISLKVAAQPGLDVELDGAEIHEVAKLAPSPRGRKPKAKLSRDWFLTQVSPGLSEGIEAMLGALDSLAVPPFGISLRWDHEYGPPALFVDLGERELAWLTAEGELQVKKEAALELQAPNDALRGISALAERCGAALVEVNEAWLKVGDGTVGFDVLNPQHRDAFLSWLEAMCAAERTAPPPSPTT